MNTEIVEIPCVIDNLLDESWLFNNVPWENFQNKVAKFILSKPEKIFAFDGETINTIEFDNMIASAIHGFAGNSYFFSFYIGEENIFSTTDERNFSTDKGHLKHKLTILQQKKLKWLETQAETVKKEIEKIKNL